jgi:hypothetical protein
MKKRTRFPNPNPAQSNLAQPLELLDLGEPLPPVVVSGWARVGTGKFHHYQDGVSSCNYQRQAGVLTFAETKPLAGLCCSSCTNNLRKQAALEKQAQTPRGRKQIQQAAGELAARMGQVFPTDANQFAQGAAGGRGEGASQRILGAIISGAWLDESTSIDPAAAALLAGQPAPRLFLSSGPTMDQLYGPPTFQRPNFAQGYLDQQDARRALFDADPLRQARALGVTLEPDELAAIASGAQYLAKSLGLHIDVAYSYLGGVLAPSGIIHAQDLDDETEQDYDERTGGHIADAVGFTDEELADLDDDEDPNEYRKHDDA